MKLMCFYSRLFIISSWLLPLVSGITKIVNNNPTKQKIAKINMHPDNPIVSIIDGKIWTNKNETSQLIKNAAVLVIRLICEKKKNIEKEIDYFNLINMWWMIRFTLDGKISMNITAIKGNIPMEADKIIIETETTGITLNTVGLNSIIWVLNWSCKPIDNRLNVVPEHENANNNFRPALSASIVVRKFAKICTVATIMDDVLGDKLDPASLKILLE